MKIDSIRKDYESGKLNRKNVNSDPLKQLELWLKDALNSNVSEPTAMAVVTMGVDGFPQSRIVLLKDLNEEGLTFFTNYLSEKGKDLLRSQKVGLHMFWPEMERQVRISGFAEKTSNSVSDRYFKSRPQLSQIAAIVSPQSHEIPNREFLENRFFDYQNQLQGKDPQRPESWGGYQVKPEKIEFWQGRENRLHDRVLYLKEENNWTIKRLAP